MLNLGDVGFSLVAPNSGLIRFNKNLQLTARAFDRANAAGSRFGSLLAGGALGAGLYAGIKSTLTLADNYQVLSRRIATASDSVADFEGNMDSMVSTAMQTGTALNTNVKLFQDLKRAGLGTSEEIRTLGSAVAQMGVLSGSTTEDMKYGLRQLSQGLSAGVFRAEEFNSVQENTPEIMKQIRIGLGKTQGQLRQMVLDGKLLSEDVFRVLVERADEVAAAFAKIPPDMARGIETAKTGLTVFFGQLDKGLQLTRTLAQAAFDFGNFIASDDALNKALMGIAKFKVYFREFLYEPAKEAFDFIKFGFSELANASGNGFSGFLTAAENIDTAKDSMSGMGLAATLLAASLTGKLIPPVVNLGKAFVTTAFAVTSLFVPGITLAIRGLTLLKPYILAATASVLRFSLALLLNPVGLFIAGIASIGAALGYFAGKSADTGSKFTDIWVGMLAVIKTFKDRAILSFSQIGSKITEWVNKLRKTLAESIPVKAFVYAINTVARTIVGFVNGTITVFAGMTANIINGFKGIGYYAILAFKKLTKQDTTAIEQKIQNLVKDIGLAADVAGQYKSAFENANNIVGDGFAKVGKSAGTFVKKLADEFVEFSKYAADALELDEFWKDVTANAQLIGKKYGKNAGKGYIDSLIDAITNKMGALAPEVKKEFEKLKKNIGESPMQISKEDAAAGKGFEEAGEKKASEFMQGYNDAFDAFSQSTSQMLTDALFGDSSVSFKEIARKLVKDLLTNTLQFLIISPITKDIQRFMGSLFKAPDGSNPFDALAGAANGMPKTKTSAATSGGGFSKILGGIGAAFGMLGGGSSTSAAVGAVGKFTSSFLSPDAGSFMNSNFESGAQASNSSSINNIFNIETPNATSFQMARGRIANDITRSSRNA